MNTPRRLAALFAMLMVLSAAAFVVGTTVERSQGHSEAAVSETHTDEGSETHHEGASEETEGAKPHSETSENSETIAGIDVEGTPLIVLGALLSLALAGAALRWPRREVFAVATAFLLGFAALDVREVAHQLDENASGVAALASLTLAPHLAATAVAVLAITRTSGDRPAATAA
ncbi:hypothetical protein [Nocardioides pyridinolyticus]